MESCLLCLEINKEFVGCIKADSTQWQNLNIKNIIEKHFWIIESLLPSSWLCHTCWQALYDFHKFYVRIEEAQMEFGKLMKTKIEPKSNNNEDATTRDENDENEENKEFFASHLEPEILIDQLLMEDHKSIIKKEPSEDIDEDNIPLIQRRTRSYHSKEIAYDIDTSQDPLKNPKQSKKSSKCKNRKKEPCQQLKTELENTKIETLHVNQDSDLKMQDMFINSPNSSDSNDFDNYTDNDYKPEKETKRAKQTTKKRKTRKRNSCDSDSNTDCDNKPDADGTNQTKQTSKQKDQFLAENFKMSCVLCQIPMANFYTLAKHFQTEHKERGYAVCCNKKFYHRIMLVEHIHRHIDPSNFKCDECGKELSSRKSLKTHQLSHLSEEEKKFACTECGKTFAEQNLLSIHINQVHLKKYLRICDICGKRLVCGEVFQRHMLEHEGKSLPTIRCDVCGLHVSSKHGLGRHKRNQHPVGGKKDYICSICQKVSPNGHALRQHMRVIHNPTTIHKCTMCERVFKKLLALKEHMATHTGIALYTCPWCPKTFNANGGLHAHRKRQHPIEWEESRRQKRLERYKTLEISNINSTDLKVDLPDFDANINAVDLN